MPVERNPKAKNILGIHTVNDLYYLWCKACKIEHILGSNKPNKESLNEEKWRTINLKFQLKMRHLAFVSKNLRNKPDMGTYNLLSKISAILILSFLLTPVINQLPRLKLDKTNIWEWIGINQQKLWPISTKGWVRHRNWSRI